MHVFLWERWKKYIKECSATSFDLATLHRLYFTCMATWKRLKIVIAYLNMWHPTIKFTRERNH